MATLILVRHGETDWNRDGRWQGQADAPLNERGREQARAVADELAGEPVEAVYASDLSRARETAEIIAARLGLQSVEVDRRLREVHVGSWSGLTMAEIEARFPTEVERWRTGDPAHAFAGGETYAAMGERVVEGLAEIAERHPAGEVVIVLHGGSIRGALAHVAGITYAEQSRRRSHVGNCGVVRVAVRNGAFAGID